MRNIAKRSLAVLACALLPALAASQEFPSRPVRTVVPFPPGGQEAKVTRE